MNSTTTNSSTPAAQVAVDHLYNGLIQATLVLNYACVAIHVAYMVMMVAIEELRKRTFVFINHASVVSILYPAGILVFQFVNPATFSDPTLVVQLCSVFEFFWPMSIYMRMFSILLIAVHRYLGVFKPDLFKRMNQSIWPNVGLVLASWLVALILVLVDKYSFKTTYSITFCLDGFSNVWLYNLLYAIFYLTTSMLVPGIAIVVIYVLISRKLASLGHKIESANIAITTPAGSSSTSTFSKKRERRFANQFILMCLVVVLNICGISIYGVRALVPNYFAVFFYWRPVVRCWILVMASLVPIISVVFNPNFKRIVRLVSRVSTYPSQNSTSRTT